MMPSVAGLCEDLAKGRHDTLSRFRAEGCKSRFFRFLGFSVLGFQVSGVGFGSTFRVGALGSLGFRLRVWVTHGLELRVHLWFES